MSYSRFLLASALVPAALFAFPSSPEAAALSYRHASTADYTHTHTSTLSAEPASRFIDMSHSYKTAAVCFLGTEGCGDAGFGSMGGDDGYQIDTAQQCQNESYTVTSCPLPAYPSGQCPYNGGYFAKCIEDKPRACEETGFGETDCAAGTVIEATCSYDANYKKCKCDPCDGYDYTYEQATEQGYITDGSCQSCSETKYKRKENPCSGYSVCECGGEVGASTCYTGSTKKFSQCKACCDDTCPSGYSLTMPDGCYDTATTECGTTCYKEKSCCYEVETGKQVYGSCYCHPNSYWYPIDGYSICCSISYTIYYNDGRTESGDELRNCGGDERDPSSCDRIIAGNCSYMEGREMPVYETICD